MPIHEYPSASPSSGQSAKAFSKTHAFFGLAVVFAALALGLTVWQTTDFDGSPGGASSELVGRATDGAKDAFYVLSGLYIFLILAGAFSAWWWIYRSGKAEPRSNWVIFLLVAPALTAFVVALSGSFPFEKYILKKNSTSSPAPSSEMEWNEGAVVRTAGLAILPLLVALLAYLAGPASPSQRSSRVPAGPSGKTSGSSPCPSKEDEEAIIALAQEAKGGDNGWDYGKISDIRTLLEKLDPPLLRPEPESVYLLDAIPEAKYYPMMDPHIEAVMNKLRSPEVIVFYKAVAEFKARFIGTVTEKQKRGLAQKVWNTSFEASATEKLNIYDKDIETKLKATMGEVGAELNMFDGVLPAALQILTQNIPREKKECSNARDRVFKALYDVDGLPMVLFYPDVQALSEELQEKKIFLKRKQPANESPKKTQTASP